ncbi:MAG: type IV pilus modification PilV family protein [Candidatus Acidiferrales bacterium]
MSQQHSFSKKRAASSGFTLIEVIVAIAVLSVGLMGVAMVIGATLATGTKAKYMSMADVLASEKLDDLNKLPANDPNLVPGGALNSNPCAAGDQYCDQVTVSEASGADYETETEMVGTPPAAVTTTIVHTNTGCVDTPANCDVADPSGGGSTFTRRWLITANPTVDSSAGSVAITGARRVTVLVTLSGAAGANAVSFQMSMVRP